MTNKLLLLSLRLLSVCLVLALLIPNSLAFLDRSGTNNQTGVGSEYIDGEDETVEVEDVETLDGTLTLNGDLGPVVDDTTLSDPPKNVSVDCQCGIKNPGIGLDNLIDISVLRQRKGILEPLIVSIPGLNTEAAEREFPWIVAITRIKYGKKYVMCGGSLINSRYVVTAAHCINRNQIGKIELHFNVHNITTMGTDPLVERRKVKSFIVHPQWDPKTVDNDIGLLELDTPIDFTSSLVRPICLPSNHSTNDFDGLNATVAGWGYINPNGPNSKVLNKVEVPIYSERECLENTIYKDTHILPSMICAGYDEGGRDACTNDSGGPLTVEQDGKSILVGIVSWGHGCAKPKAPGVYTRVTRYVDWITKEISRGEWCNA